MQQVLEAIQKHDTRSQQRCDKLAGLIESKSGDSKMEGINSDKVNINLGEGGGGGGMQAAVIAALGNRNQGNDNAALIAALGNRNDGHHGDDGIMGGGLGLIALLALVGGRGFGRDDKDCNDAGRVALTQSIMESVADIRAQIPQSALETTIAVQRAVSELALGTQQGLANVKDSVQAIGALNLSAVQGVAKDVATGTLQTIIAINNDGAQTRALLTAFNNESLNRQLTVAQSALAEERVHRHSDGVEVRVSQNVNQQQAQAQTQTQLAGLFNLVHGLTSQVQRVSQGQDVINFGTMAASGNQQQTSSQVGK